MTPPPVEAKVASKHAVVPEAVHKEVAPHDVPPKAPAAATEKVSSPVSQVSYRDYVFINADFVSRKKKTYNFTSADIFLVFKLTTSSTMMSEIGQV